MGDPAQRERLGFVFQDATLLPWLDVFGNVYLPSRLAGVSRARAAPRVEEALALVGLSGFREALPRELSGGMKMRCAIARALVTRPALLLMDEPFAALDEVTRIKLNNDLLALKARLDTTIVFVTDSVGESVYLSTRIVVLAAKGDEIIDQIPVDPGMTRDAEYRLGQVFSQLSRRASNALGAPWGRTCHERVATELARNFDGGRAAARGLRGFSGAVGDGRSAAGNPPLGAAGAEHHLEKLIEDRELLFSSLLVTLSITLQALALATVCGVLLALAMAQSNGWRAH